MVTWWDWNTSFNLVFHVYCFIFLLSHSWILSISQQSPINHAGLHYLLYFYPLLFSSIFMNPWLTSPGSLYQDLLIPLCTIHNYSEWVTGIFSLVTGDDFIRDSCLLEILPYSIHDPPEFSLSDLSHMPCKIRFWGVLCHDIIWFLFTLNILDISILLFHHVTQKMTTNINVLCTNIYLPVLS